MKRFGISIRGLLIFSCSFLCSVPEVFSSGAITLRSIQIFNTHEWLAPKPTIYFFCQGENKTILPDVKEKHFLYSFKGEESWQPVTELPDKKCKRCGLYEMDRVKSDDIFDEWELCRDSFLDGNYEHYKEKEFNATFVCVDCVPAVEASSNSKHSAPVRIKNILLAIVVGAMTSVVTAIGGFGVYKYWQKRKRERDQARFLKLFEEGDDMEDELGLDHF